jgi:hypothetical protein
MARDERGIVCIFRNHVEKNERKSVENGRPSFDDVEVCELRFAGSKTVSVFPAMSFSHWDTDEETGDQRRVTYAERFPKQYQQFKAHQQQTKAGTPLDYLPFLTDGKRAELRALNIYTAEALAAIDGQELKNLGPGGREWKNQAIAFLETSTGEARFLQMEAEIERLKAQNQVFLDDAEARKKDPKIAEYEHMTDDQLRDHVQSLTGIAPKGNLPRKTLIRMAQEHKVTEAA